MKIEDIFPYLQKFVTVIEDNGTAHSGYIANVDEIQNCRDSHVMIQLLNGFFQEAIDSAHVLSIQETAREETISIPVVDLKKGYEKGILLKPDDFVLYQGEIDQELSDLYTRYIERFQNKPDIKESLGFDIMDLSHFKKIIRQCLQRDESVDVVLNAFVQAFYQAFKKDNKS